MAAVQGFNRHLGTQDRPRQTDRQYAYVHFSLGVYGFTLLSNYYTFLETEAPSGVPYALLFLLFEADFFFTVTLWSCKQ
jgi:hypothetical protein